MSVLNNFSVSISRGLRRLRGKKLPVTLKRRSSSAQDDQQQLEMRRCLIVSKVTRYEYEKHSHENIEDSKLEAILRKRGSDFDTMINNHREQKEFEDKVANTLQSMGVHVEIANRLTYNEDLIKWCDVVVPCGGDGTFLLAASRVRDANKPVIGFNSAPHKSVGRLCLPTWCSNDVKGALHALKEGRFRWMRRTRIRTTVTSEQHTLDKITPIDLHTLNYCRYPPTYHSPESLEHNCRERLEDTTSTLSSKVLPFLALNEVFIGESVTSRVSLLRLQIDNGKWTHTKSSGLCVTTGTGSTSWHFSINCLRTHSVLELIRILSERGVKVDVRLETARELAEEYNQRVMFAPDSELLAYSIREQITSERRPVTKRDSDELAYSIREYITFEDWPTPRGLRVRDKAKAVRVKSHCCDAGLVIDGSVSYPFNDGAEALLEARPEDALKTVQMDDTLPNH